MEQCGSNVSPLFTRPNARTSNQHQCKRQLVAPINGIPLYIESHKSCQTVNFLTSNQAKSSLNPAELVLNPGEVWRLLFCCATSAMMVSAPWSFQTLCSSDRLFLLVISSAVVEYTDLYLNRANNEPLLPTLADQGHEILSEFPLQPKDCLLQNWFSHQSCVLYSRFHVTWSVCLAALLPGTQIAFVESKAKSFTLTPANPEWEERC